MKKSIYEESERYYAEHYEIIFKEAFEAEGKVYLQDHDDGTLRLCRFCGKGTPEVSFKNTAHAVPDFLGNRRILSLNECDKCNHFLANQYEDHLSKWSLYFRSLTQINAKGGKPKFKNPAETLQVYSNQDGIQISLSDPKFNKESLYNDAERTLCLPNDAQSQKYVPLRAAMALIKIACSLVPKEELPQVAPAIQWMMDLDSMTVSNFMVLYASTPGPISKANSEVILLRRKNAAPIPYLWCIVQIANIRLQTFIPLCPADTEWLKLGQSVNLKFEHYPIRFGPDWPYGETKVGWYDWSGKEPTQSSSEVSLQIVKMIRSSSPPETGEGA